MSHKALILLRMHSVDLDYCFVHVMMLCFFNELGQRYIIS